MADFTRGDYQFTIIDSVELYVSAEVIDKRKTSYESVPQSVRNDRTLYTVTSIENCFGGCSSLTISPTIPSSVIYMYDCFTGCSSLTTPPTIPSSVKDIQGCFSGCSSLTTPPTIPSSVKNMSSCFRDCTSLTTAPTIPSSVIYMSGCFMDCTSLTTAPTIPNSVTDMDACFRDCTSLTTAPTIPSSVIYMYDCFMGCTSLTGNCVINNSSDQYKDIFKDTVKGIWLTGSSGKLNEIASAYDNVFVGSIPTPTMIPTMYRVGSKFSTDDEMEGEWLLISITNWNWANFEENDITGLEVSENSADINTLTWYRQNGDNWEEIGFTNYSPATTDEIYTWIPIDEFTHTYALSANDKYGNGLPITVTIAQVKRLLDFKAGGTGMAIGMPSTEDGLHIDFDTTFYNSVQKPDMTTAEITAFINELRGVTS